MKLLTTEYTVIRLTHRESFESYQVLMKVTRLFGIAIWKSEQDREEVPTWATISLCCFGFSEWESRLLEEHKELLK